MRRPLVSVVMAVRDSRRFVEEAVRSALAQTYSPLEMIVIDDGSTDGTSEVLASIHDDRLRVVRVGFRGSAAARNAGVALAKGRYVAFLDGDDLWSPAKLDRHVRFMEAQPGIDLTFSRSRLMNETGANLPLPVRRVRGRYDFESLLRDNVIGNGSAVVLRREAIPASGFNVELAACVDYDMWLRVALIRPGNVAAIPEVLTSYRRHPGQVSGDWRRMQSAWETLIVKMKALVPGWSASMEKSARANWFRYLAFVAYERGEGQVSFQFLMKSFRAAPLVAALNWRTWLLGAAVSVRSFYWLPSRSFQVK